MPLVRTTVYRVTLAQRLSQSLKDPVALEHWRSSLVPASAVIPAPAVYFLVVAAKVPDVRLSLGQRPTAPSAGLLWEVPPAARQVLRPCRVLSLAVQATLPDPVPALDCVDSAGRLAPSAGRGCENRAQTCALQASVCVERFSSALCRLDGSLLGTCLSRTWSTPRPSGRWQASIDRGITGTGDADRTVL